MLEKIYFFMCKYFITATLIFFNKQLDSGLSPQSCLHFQVFWDLKLLNGCLVVRPSNLCVREIQ